MDDQEALWSLGAGDESERKEAKEWLLDRYHASLVATLMCQFRLDEDYAYLGAADAFLDLFSRANSPDPIPLGIVNPLTISSNSAQIPTRLTPCPRTRGYAEFGTMRSICDLSLAS